MPDTDGHQDHPREDGREHGQGHPGHEGHGHHHDLREVSRRRLWWALAINLVFLIVEVIGGVVSNSLALLADAGHMLTDVAALGLALIVSYLAARPATPERTYGLMRAEVLGAFVNGATLVLIVGLIVREAYHRIGNPQEVAGPLMLGIAVAGLIANLVSAKILAGSRKENLNVEGAYLHMMGDALGSVGAIIAGAVIWLSGWELIDPIVSVVIGLIILYTTWALLKSTINILLEATPDHIDYNEVKSALEAMEHVERVHDLHIWTISSGVPVLSAHLGLSACGCDGDHWQTCLAKAQTLLAERFGIEHTTLQVESSENAACDRECKLME